MAFFFNKKSAISFAPKIEAYASIFCAKFILLLCWKTKSIFTWKCFCTWFWTKCFYTKSYDFMSKQLVLNHMDFWNVPLTSILYTQLGWWHLYKRYCKLLYTVILLLYWCKTKLSCEYGSVFDKSSFDNSLYLTQSTVSDEKTNAYVYIYFQLQLANLFVLGGPSSGPFSNSFVSINTPGCRYRVCIFGPIHGGFC